MGFHHLWHQQSNQTHRLSNYVETKPSHYLHYSERRMQGYHLSKLCRRFPLRDKDKVESEYTQVSSCLRDEAFMMNDTKEMQWRSKCALNWVLERCEEEWFKWEEMEKVARRQVEEMKATAEGKIQEGDGKADVGKWVCVSEGELWMYESGA